MLTWCLYRLSLHPEWVKRLREEAQGIMDSIGDRPLSYSDLKSFIWLECFIFETLRLHPSIPSDSKEAINDDRLPDGTFVPAKSIMYLCPVILNKCDPGWNDADDFNPERWNQSDRPSAYQYLSFNAGPRTCLGKYVAMMEGKMYVFYFILFFLTFFFICVVIFGV